MNPQNLILPDTSIHRETELALLQIPVYMWEPVKVIGRHVIEGAERVLVARKHGFQLIPVQGL